MRTNQKPFVSMLHDLFRDKSGYRSIFAYTYDRLLHAGALHR